jgi:phage baseplate assembly protein W
MSGMSATTGRALDDMDHIRQSVRDIITTPQGSRVARRDYGSLIPQLIDHPANPATRLRLMAASVGAIARWERRIRITRADFYVDDTGTALIDMEAVRVDGPRTGQAVSMAVRAS